MANFVVTKLFCRPEDFPSRFSTSTSTSTDSESSSGVEKKKNKKLDPAYKEALRGLSLKMQALNRSPTPAFICPICGVEVYDNNFPYFKAHLTHHNIFAKDPADFQYEKCKLQWMRTVMKSRDETKSLSVSIESKSKTMRDNSIEKKKKNKKKELSEPKVTEKKRKKEEQR